MPVVVDGNIVPTIWAGRKRVRMTSAAETSALQSKRLTIALINNMPDPALEDTELQFFELLNNASGDIPLQIKLYSLPNIPRSDRAQKHLRSFYRGSDDLLNSQVDGVIVTGTEPFHLDLRDEPYWRILTSLLDWAERNTSSAVLSCLAAHAGVLHGDGIPRHRLSDKQFGVFDYQIEGAHLLTKRIENVMQIPHSRWNEVRGDALVECGYDVLTTSAQGGVDLFVKKKRDCLFVHFQGHPEYGTGTLLKEYRRDVRRFLRHESATYPAMPHEYFNASASKLLNDFRENALCDPREEQMSSFPESVIAETLRNTWALSAMQLYRNWFQYLLLRKADSVSSGAIMRLTS